ncbi:MAG: GGDEF domain-containing protein [Betaproteobacteria bacterium]|nr:MAG: GGDEF domain-containing protein [Betaproteobacteria bacterium]
MLLAFGAAAQAPHPAQALITRAIAASRVNPEDGRRLAEQALERARAEPDADLELRALLVLCEHYAEREHTTAQALLARASALLPRAKRGSLRAGMLSCEGEIQEALGENAKALATYERAVSVAEAEGDEEMLANAAYLRGWLRGVLGDYALGLIDLRRAMALYEKLALPEHARTAVNGIATVYNRMGDYAQAQHYYEQTLKAQLAAGTQREAIVTLYNIGRTRENLRQWDGARNDFATALEMSRRLGYARGEAYALRGLASVDNAQGNARLALQRLEEAQRLHARLPDARLRAQIELQRGIALRLLKRYGESVAALNNALAVFRGADSLAELSATHAALADTYAEMGDWRAAYDHQRRLKEGADRLHARQIDQRVASLKVEFDTAAKDKENALLLREKAATEAALEQQRRAGRLQAVVIALAALLASLLAILALRHRRTSRQMRALAMTDELTGLSNRRHLLTQLAGMIEKSGAPPCALLIADLDHFKPINDAYGHLIGDEVLKAVAVALKGAVREPVLLGRLGGEEFLVVLPSSDLEAARHAGERIREAVAGIDARRWFKHRTLTISVGVTVAQPGVDTVSAALKRADEALYAAKAAGRNCVRTRDQQAPLRLAVQRGAA